MKLNFLVKGTLSLITASLLVTTVLPSIHAEEITQKPVITNEQEQVNYELDEETAEDLAALETMFANPALLEKTMDVAPTVGLSPTFKAQAGTTAAVKAGIKALIKNKQKVFNLVRSVGGKRAAKSLEIRWNKHVEPVLNKLLKYESLAWGTVEGQLASALMGTGIKNSSARSIAYWVVYVARWLL
ncbi:hypothetical protein [Bacillus inaquosorum]|uniref:hypothetical protein n=1 Tax=Bacillus inaquosorum TaxID=483913 RepID=UPI0022813A4A|nr:hypothetical protein [Bacillus inaquosorum]MCY8280173.1 hypothetical protein [Bacillus inaquosorum]MCY8753467.1 hypothetical protein [Bacillus inaquosorum]MCY9343456.1 hypothetical protein [Bacillus inaquosorum]MEC0677928.1 hypothetical protein [Bacillus inaquosorum]MEC3624155.1 hypothetical protein [Bacillus inaquosorum]